MTAIKVRNLRKSFAPSRGQARTVKSLFTGAATRKRTKDAARTVLDNVSFEVSEGEFFGIVGRNGSGKSTLLKILAQIYQPTSGSARVNGRLVPFIELGVGFNPELSGRDNVYLNGALLGFSRVEIDKQYEDIVNFAELGPHMSKKLKNYSSGMQVRLAFSMAIRAESDILLIDEVLAVGDADFQKKCFDYFKSLKKDKKTVVFVSHDMNAVREFCDKAILLENGKIAHVGTADKIAELYTRAMEEGPATPTEAEKSERWGDGTIEIKSPQVHISKDFITIKTSLKAVRDCENLVSGMSIYAADGQTILGTNSTLLHVKLPKVKAGETRSITWDVPNVFKDGTYHVSLTCHGYGGQPVYDWWDTAGSFRIALERMSPYVVEPTIILKTEK